MKKPRPRILNHRVVFSSPWMKLIEKNVEADDNGDIKPYYCITQASYVGILAQAPNGLIPVVRQFRPCVEDFTWEFPGGTLDTGETAAEAARRELLEEVGLRVLEITYLGNSYPDTGRLQVDSHAFYAKTTAIDEAFIPEKGMTIKFVTPKELRRMMLSGKFRHQLHLAIYASVQLHGINLDFVDHKDNTGEKGYE